MLAAGCGRVAGQVDFAKAKLKTPAQLTEKAPATYKAKFDTSKGPFVVEVHRDWAPNGADRFYNLVKNGFFDDARFFRVVPTSWCSSASTAIRRSVDVAATRTSRTIRSKQSNKRGFVTFATARHEHADDADFHQLSDNACLDAQGFTPFGEVTQRHGRRREDQRASTARSRTRDRFRRRATST